MNRETKCDQLLLDTYKKKHPVMYQGLLSLADQGITPEEFNQGFLSTFGKVMADLTLLGETVKRLYFLIHKNKRDASRSKNSVNRRKDQPNLLITAA